MLKILKLVHGAGFAPSPVRTVDWARSAPLLLALLSKIPSAASVLVKVCLMVIILTVFYSFEFSFVPYIECMIVFSFIILYFSFFHFYFLIFENVSFYFWASRIRYERKFYLHIFKSRFVMGFLIHIYFLKIDLSATSQATRCAQNLIFCL
jgi:hypothetical protein